MWVNQAHLTRCRGKRGYSHPTIAERYAKRASERSGTFIIAYECPDCGYWHIGHPDPCQYAAISKPLCQGCRESIPDGRLDKFCADRCKLEYVARKAHEAMLRGDPVRPLPKIVPIPAKPSAVRFVVPITSPRPVYSQSFDLSKIKHYTRGAKTKKERKKTANPQPPPISYPDLLGVKFGAFTVIRRIRSKWDVRCICGIIENRSSKAVTNPANTFDACVECRKPVGKLRSDIFKETGVEVTWEDCFQHLYGDLLNPKEQDAQAQQAVEAQ